jgi:methylated-DNA-[protein]-cysteine S-methyltransferase
MYAWRTVATQIGQLAFAATIDGLVCVSFGRPESLVRSLQRKGEVSQARPGDAILEAAATQLYEYGQGHRTEFTVELDWSLTSGVQQQVLRTLYETVPFGTTVTYGELARRCGMPGGARVIGQIMGSNPLPIVVPCHRVLAANGLGGYGPGLDVKRRILILEGQLEPSLFD